jgi:hypothetical protein
VDLLAGGVQAPAPAKKGIVFTRVTSTGIEDEETLERAFFKEQINRFG